MSLDSKSLVPSSFGCCHYLPWQFLMSQMMSQLLKHSVKYNSIKADQELERATIFASVPAGPKEWSAGACQRPLSQFWASKISAGKILIGESRHNPDVSRPASDQPQHSANNRFSYAAATLCSIQHCCAVLLPYSFLVKQHRCCCRLGLRFRKQRPCLVVWVNKRLLKRKSLHMIVVVLVNNMVNILMKFD